MTGISWTHWPGTKGETWNPLRAIALVGEHQGAQGWACERISPGCENCYSETLNVNARYGRGTGLPYRRGQPVDHVLDARVLEQPLHWREPRTVFVCSMTDLFGHWVTNEQIAAVFGVMAATPDHRYLLLTKRAARLPEWFAWLETDRNKNRYRYPELIEHAAVMAGKSDRLFRAANEAAGRNFWPLPNVWLGVSVEDQQRANERLPFLVRALAHRRFVSYEPALGPADFSRWLVREFIPCTGCTPDGAFCAGHYIGAALDWVIGGAESGSGRRPCPPERLITVREECRDAGVPFFCKQGSAFRPGERGNLPADLWETKEFPS